MAAGDLVVVQRQPRVNDCAADHLAGVAEVVVVVGVRAAEREHGGDRVAPPPGPSCPLLVVGAGRRHVPQRHPGQVADVDADLHRGRAGQHVDRGPRRLAGTGQAEVYVLEEKLVLLRLREHRAGLGGVELGGVLGRDDAHRRLRRAGQGALRAGPVVALACFEHRVGGRVQGANPGGTAVHAPVGPGEGPLRIPAALAVAPQPAGFQRHLPGEQAVRAAPVLAECVQQDRHPLRLELLSHRAGR